MFEEQDCYNDWNLVKIRTGVKTDIKDVSANGEGTYENA